MIEERLTEFLKDYASTLREDTSWLDGAPFSPQVRMASGQAKVVDKEGRVVAVFMTKVPSEEYNSSCPVSPRDVQASKLLADVLNFLAKQNRGD